MFCSSAPPSPNFYMFGIIAQADHITGVDDLPLFQTYTMIIWAATFTAPIRAHSLCGLRLHPRMGVISFGGICFSYVTLSRREAAMSVMQ